MRYSAALALLLLLASAAKAQPDTLIIHFDLDRTDIRPADAALLDSLVVLAPGLASIMLTGHTDGSGSNVYNDGLSLRRAQTVRNFLQAKGVPDSLFRGMEGFGSHRPRDPLHAALNRRVEIIVTHRPKEAAVIRESPPSALQQAFSDTTTLTGKNIILRNVNFYGDRHIPLPESYLELNELLTVMKQHPRMVIQIRGYVCCMPEGMDGRDADNRSDDLSAQRAKFVYDFLAEQGIAKSRMSYQGFGASNKIYPSESNEQERRANRRVEIKVISR